MKVVVTGAAGQLGQALQPVLRDHQVTALARAQLDIASFGDVRASLAALRPDIVVNAAAYNQVDTAESSPADAFRGNSLAPRNLAVATADLGIPLLHVSSDYVFDGEGRRPYHEFDRTGPRSAYGESKLAGEEAVRAVNPRHYIVRTAWLLNATGRNFALTMAGLRDRPEVRVVSDQYGSPTYVPHLAAAMARLIGTGAFGTYHFAGAGGASWFELTRFLYAKLGIETAVRPVPSAEFPRPARRPAYSVLTTMQDPAIVLPAWEDGVSELAHALQSR